MELEDLLRRASTVPLGPIAFTFMPSGARKWALNVTLDGMTRSIQAEQDAATDGLILACAIDGSAAAFNGAWVTDIARDESSGETVRRLWLHGDGLSSTLLLNALAALASVAATAPATADDIVLEMPPIIIPPPPTPNAPDPVPVERPRPVGWNSFGHRETPEPESEPAAVTDSASQSEATGEAATAPGPAIEPAGEAPVGPDASVAGDPAAGELTTVPQPAPQPVGAEGHCRECGSPFLPDHAFCTNCGARLN